MKTPACYHQRFFTTPSLTVGLLPEWHGRLARELTRKMRVPHQNPVVPANNCLNT
jgi:hypothetical protein